LSARFARTRTLEEIAMPPAIRHTITLVARVLLSLIFVLSAIDHLRHWESAVQRMSAQGLGFDGVFGSAAPAVVHVLLTLAVAFLLLGGLSVMLGLRARWGAAMLLVFFVPATLVFHDFWTLPAGTPEYTNQLHHFLKNLGLMGGLLTVLGFGPGGFSLEAFLPRRSPPA
jgi:putative oxidoreductase